MSTQNQVAWRDVPGYEGLYQVSDNGRVFSMPKRRERKDGSVYYIAGKELSAAQGKYPFVGLWKNGSMRYFRVHQLVMLAFVGPRPEGMIICHRDDNPKNNTLQNLRYDTHLGNARDRVRNKAKRKTGARCTAGHRLTDKNVETWGTGNRICVPCREGDPPVRELPDSIFR